MRFWLVLAGATLCAALVAGSGLVLTLGLEHTQEVRLDTRATLAANALRSGLATRFRIESAQMRDLCKRDVRIERLGLELIGLAGIAADVSRVALGLLSSKQEDVWIILEQQRKLKALGTSAGNVELPSLAALEEAQAGPLASRGSPRRVLFACRRELGARGLWLVRAVDPELVRSQAMPDAPSARLTFSAAEGAHGPLRVSREVARVPGVDGSEPLILSLRVSAIPESAPLGSWIVAMALAFGLGGVGSMLLTQSRTGDEQALLELERAAERVAQGDLSSTIGLRLGGRADQTFQKFDRMTRELRDMRTQLADAERAAAFKDIAQRIAHEIKNPLSPIQMAIETLRKAHQKSLPSFDEIFEESTRAVLEEVRRLERIVKEFSEFARLPKPRPGALELGALLADTAALYAPPDVDLEVEHALDLPNVRADREQITQVIVNLLQNAIDAARQAQATPRVALRAQREGKSVVLHVDDSGPGVLPVDVERIFEPYVTTKAQGTGLGLSIVKRIILDHGGKIRVTASPLGGARFSVTLPEQPPTETVSFEVDSDGDHSTSIP